MRLFVDDTRPFPPQGYECCRDYNSAILLLSIIPFEHISLDYSLGHDCPTGLDILLWMAEHHVFVPEINIHSNHIIGREKMKTFCEEHFPQSKVTMHMLLK